MVAIDSIDGVPRSMMCMDYRSCRKIIFFILINKFFIMPAFIAIAPKYNGRMIGISNNHFSH
ncbi:hypothetical protein D3C81_917880 [compost metagenome]